MKRFQTAVSFLLILMLLQCFPPLYGYAADDGEHILRRVSEGTSTFLVDENGKRVSPVAYPYQKSDSCRGELPSSFDGRSMGYVTYVKNQNPAGVCWAFASTAALEANVVKNGILPIQDADFSEAHLANFAERTRTTNENDRTFGRGKDADSAEIWYSGGSADQAGNYFARSGAAPEAKYPFVDSCVKEAVFGDDARYDGIVALRGTHELDAFTTAEGDNETLRDEIKSGILQYGAATVSYYNDQKRYYVNNSADTVAYYSGISHKTNHMVTVIGWDDGFSRELFSPENQPPQNGAWLCKNSWGESAFSEMNGYFWMSYYEPTACNFTAFEAMPCDFYDNVYQYDVGLVASSYYTDASNGGEQPVAANIFRADGSEKICFAGFYTTCAISTVKVWIYTGLTDLSDPTSGSLAGCAGGEYRYPGYHTLQLNDIPIREGEYFSICALEYNNGTVIKSSSSEEDDAPYANMSFKYNRFTEKWEANTDKSNYCLKVFSVAEPNCDHTLKPAVPFPAFCYQKGYTMTECSICGKQWFSDYTPYADHEPNYADYTIYKEPTCSETGLANITCQNCGLLLFRLRLPEVPHSYDEGVLDAGETCLTGGSLTKSCVYGCGTTIQETLAPQAAHLNIETRGQTPATCTAEGYSGDTICTVCGTLTEQGHSTGLKNHDYRLTETVAATCTEGGYKLLTCEVCGATKRTNETAASGHAFGWIVDLEPTCADNGVKHEECNVCHVKRNENTPVDPTGNHSYTAETVKADALKQASTCSAPAEYYYSCATCGAVEFNDEHTFTSGSAIAHSWQWVEDTAPTCVDPGVQHEECSVCHEKRNENTAIEATGNHSYTAQTVKADALKQAASCSAPAEYYYSCATCGAVEHNDAHIFTSGNALAHDWQWIEDTAPTCGAPGVKHEECTVCHEKRNENTTVDPTGNHSYTAQIVKADALKKAATCTSPAAYYYSCATCGAVEFNNAHTFTSGSALAHDWQWVEDTAPTCVDPGVKHEECSVCHEKRNENTSVDPTGNHNYTAETVKVDALKKAASCSGPAEYYYSCATCGAVEHNDAHIFTSGNALAHDWQWIEDTAPTCGAPGVKHEECTVCHEKRNENTTVDPTGNHSYTAQIVKADALKKAATCTSPAAYYYSCATCGAVEFNNAHTFTSGSALAHDWQWVEDTAPTCVDPGVKHEECSVCHEKRNENTAIDPTGVHQWVWMEDVAPDCGHSGVKHEECSVCHEKRNENTTVAPTGNHSWDGGGVTQSPSCTAEGTKVFTCNVCGETRIEKIAKTSHTDGNGDGVCDNCGASMTNENACEYCGQVHTGFLGKIVQFFHSLILFFNKLFK